MEIRELFAVQVMRTHEEVICSIRNMDGNGNTIISNGLPNIWRASEPWGPKISQAEALENAMRHLLLKFLGDPKLKIRIEGSVA